MSHTAIFDIGKTNKKFFLFDDRLEVVHQEYANIPLIADEDGWESDDLQAISSWMLKTFEQAMNKADWDIQRLNFSTYGATMIYLDKDKRPIMRYVLNYTKNFPEALLEQFFEEYGGQAKVSQETASPSLAMLNSGLQLYFLRYEMPQLFNQIRYALHLPQYFSYLFTKQLYSEPTSIGCHTMLWNFVQQDYHQWIDREDIRSFFPETVATTTTYEIEWKGKPLTVGVGIHDSSAALLPYLMTNHEPFLLISTGTWSITLNPFNQSPLTQEELQQDCLNFLRIDGFPVKASRLFLGQEYRLQVETLSQHFDKPHSYHKDISFDEKLYQQIKQAGQPQFKLETIPQKHPIEQSNLNAFATYEVAYHRLMHELVQLQLHSLQLAKGDTTIRRIYIDGGFVDSQIFIKLLELHLPDYEIIPTQAPLGSAIGAAMAVQYEELDAVFG